ncbi:hypothetical protein MKW98_006873 [Papaver atlanticum]|uniref:Uncharacterized protein n=1 Tax=Papaver atlanticum TaxID=357466 RepID=A0AAD4SUR6_9MAGN|nr:hypothetical protein MKW98_006873 [Papaver atlanticum]
MMMVVLIVLVDSNSWEVFVQDLRVGFLYGCCGSEGARRSQDCIFLLEGRQTTVDQISIQIKLTPGMAN